MPTVSSLELALISAGAALTGVALNTVGTGYLDRRKDRRAANQLRDQAIADLLTATVDLISGVQTIRAAYQQQSTMWRHYLRIAAALIAATGAVSVPGEKLTRHTLGDWHAMSPFFDRLLAIDRDLDSKQRTIALDIVAVVGQRTARFYSAVAVLTLGPDKKIANAVRELAPAVGELLEAIAARKRAYDRSFDNAQRALEAFRDVADQRRK